MACGASGGTESAGLEARGDILLALESGMSVVDVFITHPSGVANRAAAATTDDAARRDREKRRTYGQLEPNGYPFIPFTVETYGRLGKLAISFLRQLGLEAKEAGHKVSKSGFVAAAICELSVGLCRANYQMYRASLGLRAGVSGPGFRVGAGCSPHGGVVVIGIRAPTWVTCLGRVGLACGMCGPRRRFDIACMLCVLVLIMIVWILMTPYSPL
jgi:hypothetical protein